jgi:putative addiction module killer protein
MEIFQYQTADGRKPVADWLESLRDPTASARIAARLQRLTLGLRGDWKSIGAGVFELRIDFGPGYRVYYAQHGNDWIVLLCGGHKRTQTRDIERAHEYWKDYQARTR